MRQTPRQCLRMRKIFQADEDRLTAYADEMKAGKIVRAKAE